MTELGHEVESPLDGEFRLIVRLRGPEYENDRGYKDRDELAAVDVPVFADAGWAIYRHVIEAVSAGRTQTDLSD